MSVPATVARTGLLLLFPYPCPVKEGTKYQAMATQMTTRMDDKTYFMNVEDGCMKRIMVSETPELSGNLIIKQTQRSCLDSQAGANQGGLLPGDGLGLHFSY